MLKGNFCQTNYHYLIIIRLPTPVISNMKYILTIYNIIFYRFVGAVMPPDDLEKLFEQGYDHTEEFLQSEKFKKFLADLNVPDPTIEAANIDGATEVPHENHA